MISAEDALKFIEDQANKQRKPKLKATLSAFPLSSLSEKGGEMKQGESSLGPLKEPPKRKKGINLTKEPEGVAVQFLPNPSICSNPESFSQAFPQLVFKNDAASFVKLGEVGMANQGAQITFEAMVFFSWLKERSEALAWRLSEVVSAYNDISRKYNDLQASSDLAKSENARLTKKLKEVEACHNPPR